MQGTWCGHLQWPNLELPHRQDYCKCKSNFRIHPEKHQNKKPEGERNSLQYACPPSAGAFAPVSDPSSKDKTHQLEKNQRRAAHWTASNYDTRSSVSAMLNQLDWRTLKQRRADARLCLFYKIIYGLTYLLTVFLLYPRPSVISRFLGPFLSSFIELVMSGMRKWV